MAKVLIVEDDLDIANLLAQGLQAAGHRCAIQPKADNAIEMARKHEPDLIILDLMLPGVSGFHLCRTLRHDESLYRIPILVVSAMDSEEEIRHGLAQGADDYLAKPFPLHEFVKRAQALIDANEHSPLTDHQTSLASGLGFRKLLQKRLTRDASFALIYIEMLKIRSYVDAAGASAGDRAIRHLGRALEQCGSAFKDRFFAGHLGRGHYMCVIPPSRAYEYCERIQKAWSSHQYTLIEAVPINHRVDAHALDLLFCITQRKKAESITPRELMDIVSRIHQLRSKQPGGGIHLDRRHSQLEDAPAP